MASEFFSLFYESFNFWLWMVFWAAIIITLLYARGKQWVYFFVLIVGFLVISRLVDHFYVSISIILCWLLFLKLEFFVSNWVLIFFTGLMLFFGLSSPFFYLILFALWIIMVWNYLAGSFAMMDSSNQSHK